MKMMTFDVVSFGETMLRLTSPAGVRLELAPTLRIYVAGTESNTLAGLARLGLRTAWLSALPDQPLGRHVATELRGHGIDTSHIVWMASTARMGIFYAEEAPAPLGAQVHYDRANSACALIDPDALDYSLLDETRLLHLTGITPALSEHARVVFARLLERAHSGRLPLSFDINYRARLWSADEAARGIEAACQQAHILFCTRADAADLWGISGTPEVVLRQLAQRFAVDGEHKTIVLTLGSEGAAQLQDNLYIAEPGVPTEGTMRFGSGDAFAAGYLYAYLEGSLYQQLRAVAQREITPLTFGNTLAALKRCIAGDIAVVTPDDVRRLLPGQGRRFR
jgi:2-dehydro-3-deoxygluconokinase